MAETVLIQAQPFNPADGTTRVVRLAGGGVRPYTQFGLYDWRAGLTSRPRFASGIAFDQSGFTGHVVPQTATLRFYPNAPATMTAVAGLQWIQAPITIYVGDDEAIAPSYPLAFTGTVASITTDGGSITFTVSDLSILLDKPAAPDTFAGTGDLEGGSDAVGRVKRRTFGYVFNVEGKLLDTANNVYEFSDPNRPIQSFVQVRDKGRAGVTPTTVAWQGSALATLNALRAATPPSGGATIAPSIACVKWWTVPTGPLTADLQGEIGSKYVQTAPEIAAYMVGLYAPSISVPMPPSALGWQSAIAGIHVDTATETVGSVLDRLLLPVSTIWGITPAGALAFSQATFNSPIMQLTAQTIARDTVYLPLRTRRVGFQRNYRIQSASEISATLLLATDATYADGTAIEVLKPAQANADRTLLNTAAAITGQTAFATYVGTTPGALLAPASNKIVDSTFRFGGLGWSFGTGFFTQTVAFDANAFLANSGNNGTTIANSPSFPAGSATYCLQGEMLFGGTSGSMSIDVAWKDGNGNTTYSNRLQIGPNGIIAGTDISGRQSNYYSLYAVLAGPSGTVSAIVRCYSESGNGGMYWRRLKLALGNVPTPWSDEATTSARYGSDGTLLDNLRPATIAADKTSNATAAAITGQAATATDSRFSAVTGPTRPSDYAGTTLVLKALGNTANITIAGNAAQTLGGSAYISAAQTQEAYQGSAIISCRSMYPAANAGRFAMGFIAPSNTSASNSYQQLIGFSLFPFQGFAYTLLPNGNVSVKGPAITSADSLQLVYTGSALSAQVNGVEFANMAVSEGLTVAGHFSMAETAAFTDARFEIGTARAWSSIGGAKRPTDNADVTSNNQAASIAGQGKGATANNLAQLDQAAANQLANAGAAQTTIKLTVGTSSIISRSVPNGGSITISGYAKYNTNTSQSGTGKISLQVAPGGGSSFAEIASGTTPVGSDGPGTANAQGTYTNNSGATAVFDIRAVVSAVGNTALDPAYSFLTG